MTIHNALSKIASIAAIGAIAGILAYSTYKDHQVRGPIAMADVNGDGIQDAVTLVDSLKVNASDKFQNLGYYDGKFLMKDTQGNLYKDPQGLYHARGGPNELMGTPVWRQSDSTVERMLQVGNFGGEKGLDVKVIDTTADFPICYEQVLKDVFPKGKL